VCRYSLCIVLIAAAASKVREIRPFSASIREYIPRLPGSIATFVAVGLVLSEFVTGMALMLSTFAEEAGGFAFLLLAAFTVALSIRSRRGEPFACHCFGDSRPLRGRAAVIRNAALMILAADIIGSQPRLPPAIGVGHLDAPHIFMVSVGVVSVLAVVAGVSEIDSLLPVRASEN